MKKVSILLVGILLGVMLASCGAKETGVSGKDEVKSVSAEISTDKDSYEAGETIHFTLKIKNMRRYWYIPQCDFKYTNTKGLNPVEGTELDNVIPKLEYNQYTVIEGDLVGDMDVLSRADLGAVFDLFGDTFGGSKAYADEPGLVELRPYVTVNYGGQDVTLRAVMSLDMKQEKATYTEFFTNYKTVCCHDPSIFLDKDGTYYIIGSFLAGAKSTDLVNWESIDSTFQGSLSAETRKQVREWNKDEKSTSWNGYLWAPDIVYNEKMGKYCMYLSANGDDWKSNIVLLTADAVTGPYNYAGTVVYGGFDQDNFTETDVDEILNVDELPSRYIMNGVRDKLWGDEYPNCIDPCAFYDEEGNLWMSYGSWSGGIFMLALDEETGLRDTSVKYDTNEHSDEYFGTKIAGGQYVSGEASYIQHIGDYYYLFVSYGNLEANGGYNVRVFRSTRPDGDYVDALGNSPYYDTYQFNYNQSVGIRLFGAYKWRNFTKGQVSQGHNSAFTDKDGKSYIVFHTRTTDGTEGHYVKVHQLFVNENGWIVAAPYQTNGESFEEGIYKKSDFTGDWEIMLHSLDVDYRKKIPNVSEVCTFNEDGTVTGAYTGTWEVDEAKSYIRLTLDEVNYSGVALTMKIEFTTLDTMVFTALGDNQITIWGSKVVE